MIVTTEAERKAIVDQVLAGVDAKRQDERASATAAEAEANEGRARAEDDARRRERGEVTMSEAKERKAARDATRKNIVGDRKFSDLSPNELMSIAQLDDDDRRDELQLQGAIGGRMTEAEIQRVIARR